MISPEDDLGMLTDRLDRYETALRRIAEWSDAYPLTIFPEPDEEYYRNAHRLLAQNGMTLDRIAADCMRHAIRGAGNIAKRALG